MHHSRRGTSSLTSARGNCWIFLAQLKRCVILVSVSKSSLVANCNGQIIFEHSAQLDTDSSQLLNIDYHGIHNLAKDAIHLVEGLDAALRSLECALRCHSEIEKHDPVIWNATHDALHHRREMFHSTRLRMLSVEQRLKNVINMVGHFSSSSFVRILKISRLSTLEPCAIAGSCGKIATL